MSNQTDQISSNQALATVLRFLKQHNLNATVDTLQKEIISGGGSDGTSVDSTPTALTISRNPLGNPEECRQSYVRFNEFVESSLDVHRAELAQLRFPLFVHLYVELVRSGHNSQARDYFTSFASEQESFFGRELMELRSLTSPDHLPGSRVAGALQRDKFSLRLSSDSYHCLQKFLQGKGESLLLGLINQHFSITVFDGAPRTQVDITARSGPLLGEPVSSANKSKVLYGLPLDPELLAQFSEVEEGREEAGDDDRPKKKKAKKDLAGKKAKSGASPHAPPINRMPLPKLRDCEFVARYQAHRESSRCSPLSAAAPPSVCFYSVLNTKSGLNNLVVSEDSSLMVGLYADSSVRLWSLTQQRLMGMLIGPLLSNVQVEAEDVATRMMDPLSVKDCQVLRGHSGPVFSAAFSLDNSLLITGSEDGSVRLWSLQLFVTLLVLKAHTHPVWCVDMSPGGYYLASGSQDRTAAIWTTDSPHPLRLLVGHTADVDVVKFHPNGNYLGTGSSDKTVRLWDVLNGNCVRIFSGCKDAVTALAFSPDGKYLACGGADSRVLVWCIPTAKPSAEFKGHLSTVYSLVFSRHGNILASGGLDQAVNLWDCSVLDEENSVSAGPLTAFKTKDTDVLSLHFTRRNILLGAGPTK